MPNGYNRGHVGRGTPPPVSLLLVETDEGRAERMERQLIGTFPSLVATRCNTLATARAYLSGTAFDAVCTADMLPDGPGIALAKLCDSLGLRAPVFVWPRAEDVLRSAPERPRRAGAPCVMLQGDDEAGAAAAISRALEKCQKRASCREARPDVAPDETELSGLLEALRTEAGAVAHAVNNPLTVIAGNAQLLGELARVGALDPSLGRTVSDIETAAQQLTEALNRLSALRQRIAASLGVPDEL